MAFIEHGPWAIFTDESANWSEDELLDGPFYSRKDADDELNRLQAEGILGDEAEVHVIEPADEGDEWGPSQYAHA